jgi:hypothetical protein
MKTLGTSNVKSVTEKTITTVVITSLVGAAVSLISAAAMAVPARPVVAMDAIESVGHAIVAGLKKKTIDPLFGTDITGLTISTTANGYAVELTAPSANISAPNKLSMSFDTAAKLTAISQTVVSKNPNGTLFTAAHAGTIIDFAAEAIVDHLLDVPADPDLAPVSQQVVSEELSLQASGPRIRVNLKDGRAYMIQLDKDANVLSKGF